MNLHKTVIEEIERALPYHINYTSHINGEVYLKTVDRLSLSYRGAQGIKVSKLMDDYYETVGVKNLNEAIKRLETINKG